MELRQRRALAAAALIAAAGCHHAQPTTAARPPAPAPAAERGISSGVGVIEAMHDRYAGAWYHGVTFTQRTTSILSTGRELVQTWFEAAAVPGRLRIETDVPFKGNGVLFANDSTYRFTGGKLTGADTGVNPLLVLGFDVYGQPGDRSARILRHLGFDLNKVHEDAWMGQPVYAVGAARGDTTSNQFWVTTDKLLFVRMLEHTARGRVDVRFNQYEKAGGGWIAMQVEELLNGKRVLLEQYSDLKVNPPLSPSLFDRAEFAAPRPQ